MRWKHWASTATRPPSRRTRGTSAARGIGHALLDELTAKSGAEAVTVRPVTPPLSVGVFALWRDGGLTSQAGNAFVDVLRAHFA